MTTKAEILKQIRLKCLDCCVGQIAEVRECASQKCNLWRYRFGRDPNPSNVGFAKNRPASRTVSGGKGGL